MTHCELVVAQGALNDLDDIWITSFLSFGYDQAEAYRSDPLEQMRLLMDFPDLGSDESDLGAGYRSRVYRSHQIMYSATATRVEIVRIRHTRRKH
jgi:plasmid stabilization system protein ParE